MLLTVSLLTLLGCTGVVVYGVGKLLHHEGSGADTFFTSRTCDVNAGGSVEMEEVNMRKSLKPAVAAGNKSRREFVESRLAAARSKYGAAEEATPGE